MAIAKTVIRIGVLGGLATGAAVLVAGPERVAALAGQARDSVVQRIDNSIDDPVVLRQQLRELERQYPQRIAEINGAIAELDAQASEIERDLAVAEKVVEIASSERDQLSGLIEKAETARVESPYAVISVRFDNRSLPLDQAYTRATQVNNTLYAYQSRVTNAHNSLDNLSVQRERLAEMLTKLQTEQSEFQAQIALLDSEIETIARNEKMLELAEAREKAIEDMDRFEAHSLDHVRAQMARIRSEQEARFDAIAGREAGDDYEARAKAMIGAEEASRRVYEHSNTITTPAEQRITIEGGDGDAETHVHEDRVVLRDRVVID